MNSSSAKALKSPEGAARAEPNLSELCRVANEEDRRPKKRVMLSGDIVEQAKLIGEVLEVLAHTEEVRGQGVVEQEVLDLPLDIAATRVGVVLQPATVAHLSIEHLAGGEGFVTLDEVNDVIRHIVIASPWDVGQRLVDDRRHDVHVFLEHLAAVGLESGRCVEHRDGFYTIKI